MARTLYNEPYLETTMSSTVSEEPDHIRAVGSAIAVYPKGKLAKGAAAHRWTNA